MKSVMITVEDPQAFLMEIAYINGFLQGQDKELPQMEQLNKIVEQLNPSK